MWAGGGPPSEWRRGSRLLLRPPLTFVAPRVAILHREVEQMVSLGNVLEAGPLAISLYPLACSAAGVAVVERQPVFMCKCAAAAGVLRQGQRCCWLSHRVLMTRGRTVALSAVGVHIERAFHHGSHFSLVDGLSPAAPGAGPMH